jgi:hypothetical protein
MVKNGRVDDISRGEVELQRKIKTVDEWRRMAIAFLIALAILSFPLTAFGSSTSEPSVFIDLFTQKAPFDGRGINQSSDMFGPDEKVILYALVLINGVPSNGTLVTYDVLGPNNASKDIEFLQTALTNSSGISQTEFTLAVENETAAFGTWTATASVQVEGKVYSDTLTFDVDYVIKIVSLRTLAENLTSVVDFGIGGYVGFEIALLNNAMVEENVTLAVTVFDELGVPVNSSQIPSMIIPPNKRIQYIYGNVFIPKFAVPGNATITVVALENDLVAYGPAFSAHFTLEPVLVTPIFPGFVDASVYVKASPLEVEAGETVDISLFVTNHGTLTLEQCNATLTVNGSLLATYFIGSLSSYESRVYEFNWNTSELVEGTYVLTGDVPIFPNEADLSDNTYSTQVEVLAVEPTLVHDLAITYVNCSKSVAYQGENLSIFAVVINDGNLTESSNVSVYYDDVLIEKRFVAELLPATPQVLTFEWNTASVPVGTYEIIGRIDPVEGETNLANNVYYDGSVQILAAKTQPVLPKSAFLVFSLLGLGIFASTTLFFFLLIIPNFLMKRRRKKRPSCYVLIAHIGT